MVLVNHPTFIYLLAKRGGVCLSTSVLGDKNFFQEEGGGNVRVKRQRFASEDEISALKKKRGLPTLL